AALPFRCLEVERFYEFAPKSLGPIELLTGPGSLDVLQVRQHQCTASTGVATSQTPQGFQLRRGGTPGRGRRVTFLTGRRCTNAIAHRPETNAAIAARGRPRQRYA